MPRRSRPEDSLEKLRRELAELLEDFAAELERGDIRTRVLALVPAYRKLRDLGSSLIPRFEGSSARERIIAYLRRYPQTVIDGEELMVVSGIAEWARRVRELRVQSGWPIYSGVTFSHMAAEQPEDAESLRELLGVAPAEIKPDQYVLMRPEQDREAAHRWHVLNEIRRSNASVKDKIIDYFRRNAGNRITGEELMYLAREKKEWARRVRELRTEDGWPIVTKNSGRRDLDVGVYLLEEDRQAQEHDRKIPDPVRVEVLERDEFQCVKCGWSRSTVRDDDPRSRLELHHVKPHRERGDNTPDNLVTVCNVCHDEIHRGGHGGAPAASEKPTQA